MEERGRPHPEVLAAELKIVLKAGARAARIAGNIERLPALTSLVGGSPRDDRYDIAIAVEARITDAMARLADGPYGEAASAAFGVRAASRGLLLKQRRREAATELGVEVATFRRH